MSLNLRSIIIGRFVDEMLQKRSSGKPDIIVTELVFHIGNPDLLITEEFLKLWISNLGTDMPPIVLS